MRLILKMFPLLLLSGCSSADEMASSTSTAPPSPVPLLSTDPEPLLNIGPIPLTDDDRSQLAAGYWQIGESEATASATFVSTQGRSLLSIACDLPTKVMSLAVAYDRRGNQTFVLRSGGTAARLDTIADNSAAEPHQAAAIAPQTPVFEGFVHAGGTIEISQTDGMTLRVPANPGIRRVFQACQG